MNCLISRCWIRGSSTAYFLIQYPWFKQEYKLQISVLKYSPQLLDICVECIIYVYKIYNFCTKNIDNIVISKHENACKDRGLRYYFVSYCSVDKFKSQLVKHLKNIVDIPCQSGYNNSLDGGDCLNGGHYVDDLEFACTPFPQTPQDHFPEFRIIFPPLLPTITLDFPAFTFNPFPSRLAFQSATHLPSCSIVGAIITMSSAYRSSEGRPLLASLETTSHDSSKQQWTQY